jgi:hypothetical protein
LISFPKDSTVKFGGPRHCDWRSCDVYGQRSTTVSPIFAYTVSCNMTESASKPTIKSSQIQPCSYVYFEKKNKCSSPHAIILKHLISSVQKKSVLWIERQNKRNSQISFHKLMTNVGANVLFLGSEKSYFVGKIIKKALCIWQLSFYSFWLPPVHLTFTFLMYTWQLPFRYTLHLFNIYFMWFFTILYINVIHIWSIHYFSSRFLVGFIWLNL